jgi:hypothetical protein
MLQGWIFSVFDHDERKNVRSSENDIKYNVGSSPFS